MAVAKFESDVTRLTIKQRTAIAAPVVLMGTMYPVFRRLDSAFEETLWRGVYLELFRDQRFWRVGWASVWFGLWHVIPVSINADTVADVIPMIAGSMAFGFYLAVLAKRTNSIWWPLVAHVLGGIVMVS